MTIVPGLMLSKSLAAVSTLDSRPRFVPDTAGLAALRTGVDARMRSYLSEQRAEYLRQPVFATLYDDLTEFVCRPGKRLRPLLFLLANRIFELGGAGAELPTASERDLFSIGASLEFLHAFILVHDDIIDRGETRRGKPTLHRVIEGRLSSFADRRRAGRNLALVMGDILFALAQRCLLETSLMPGAASRLGVQLLGCMVETGFGEAADIVYGTRDMAKVGTDEIEHMYCLKTTCYTIEGPLAMAAMLHGVDAAGLDALGRLARPAGLAFQIQNDLQEFARFEVSDAEVPVDILEGKKTLLIRTAFDLLNETDQGFLQLCFSAGAPTEGTVSKARELITKSGAVGKLTAKMDELFASADDEARRAPFPAEVQESLVALIHLVRDVSRG